MECEGLCQLQITVPYLYVCLKLLCPTRPPPLLPTAIPSSLDLTPQLYHYQA